MPKINLKAVSHLKPNPLFKGLKKKLKDPKYFEEVEKQLQATITSQHNHKTVSDFVTCAWCQENRIKRQKLMQKLGFKNIVQYLEWKKVMLIISNKKDFKLR